MKESNYEIYKILQLMPAGEWLAVYWDGELIAQPVDYMALVEVTTVYKEDGQEIYREADTQIIGVEMTDCGFEVVAEASNFCGMAKLADVEKTTYRANRKTREEIEAARAKGDGK